MSEQTDIYVQYTNTYTLRRLTPDEVDGSFYPTLGPLTGEWLEAWEFVLDERAALEKELANLEDQLRAVRNDVRDLWDETEEEIG